LRKITQNCLRKITQEWCLRIITQGVRRGSDPCGQQERINPPL
jgi:hypothetical protein